MTQVQFASFLRTGLAAGIAPGDGENTASVTVPVSIDLNGTAIEQMITLRGPGAVSSLDPQMIRRRYPSPGVDDFEPNFFVHVDLEEADLPWRFSLGGETEGRVRPWMVLVVIEQSQTVKIIPSMTGLPTLKLDASEDVQQLPDLDESWAWAHVQAAGVENVEDTYENRPRRLFSRIISPRRLSDKARYVAALVPATNHGVSRARGGTPGTEALDHAWSGSESTLELPVFDFWRFATGPRGDFKELVRRLTPIRLAADDVSKPLDLSAPGGGMPEIEDSMQIFHGALSVDNPDLTWSDDDVRFMFERRLDDALNKPRPHARATGADPVVDIPLYGAVGSGSRLLGEGPEWMDDANLEPALRAAAGMGALVVRRNQEAMVASAWDQARAAQEIRQANRLARFGAAISGRVASRVNSMDDADVVRLTAGAQAVIPAKSGGTLRGTSRSGAVPNGIASSAMARRLRTGGKIARALNREESGFSSAMLRSVMSRDVALEGIAEQAEPAGAPVDKVEATGALTGLQHTSTGVAIPTVTVLENKLGNDLSGFLSKAASATKVAPGTAKPPSVTVPTASTPKTAAPTKSIPSKSTTFGKTGKIPKRPLGSIQRKRPRKGVDFGLDIDATTANATMPKTIPDRFFRPYDVSLLTHAVQDWSSVQATLTVDTKALSYGRWQGASAAASQRTAASDLLGDLAIDVRNALPTRDTLERRFGNRLSGKHLLWADDTLASEMRFKPEIPSLYDELVAISPEFMLPGVGAIAEESVAMLNVNSAFIESFLLGANDELTRELRWREFPLAARATPCQTFFESADDSEAPDILPVRIWSDTSELGTHMLGGRGNAVVLLIKGALIRRYPDAIYRMVEAGWDGRTRRVPDWSGAVLSPIFSGYLGDGIQFFGFDLDDDDARGSTAHPAHPGYFVAIEEQPVGPRFGFNAAGAVTDSRTANALTWDDVHDPTNTNMGVGSDSCLIHNQPITRDGSVDRWGANAAATARITYSPAVRVCIHASQILPLEDA